MEGAAHLLTDGFAGFPLLRASPSPVPGLASAWRPQGAAAGAGVPRGRGAGVVEAPLSRRQAGRRAPVEAAGLGAGWSSGLSPSSSSSRSLGSFPHNWCPGVAIAMDVLNNADARFSPGRAMLPQVHPRGGGGGWSACISVS